MQSSPASCCPLRFKVKCSPQGPQSMLIWGHYSNYLHGTGCEGVDWILVSSVIRHSSSADKLTYVQVESHVQLPQFELPFSMRHCFFLLVMRGLVHLYWNASWSEVSLATPFWALIVQYGCHISVSLSLNF
jgi:hypothetical protein